MSVKHCVELFQQLSPITQVALIVMILVIIVLLVVDPTGGTSIIAFLVALKALATHQ